MKKSILFDKLLKVAMNILAILTRSCKTAPPPVSRMGGGGLARLDRPGLHLLYVHSLMSSKDFCATINPYSKPKISEDQTIF